VAAKSSNRRGPLARLLAYLPSIIVVLAIVALAGIGWFAVIAPAAAQKLETPPQGALPTSVTVTASNFAFVVSTNELAQNSMINVTFVDTVSTPHTFTLSSVQGVAIDQSTYGDDVSAYFAQHPFYASVGLSGVGQTTISFPSPPVGWYEFVCNVSGHFALGMYSALGFGVPAPSNLTGGGTTIQVGWPVYVIAGTIVGLVILALVLGFVAGQRKGSQHEMPPERLGYPEETPPSAGGGPSAPSPPLPPGPPPKTP
jgi:uncharacterized cupredoxin-like copper-binding protein